MTSSAAGSLRSNARERTTLATICFINQKGGCGKSSTCFHLAGEFASLGLSVLLVDADPQGSLSQGYLGSLRVENLDAPATTAVALRRETS